MVPRGYDNEVFCLGGEPQVFLCVGNDPKVFLHLGSDPKIFLRLRNDPEVFSFVVKRTLQRIPLCKLALLNV